MSKEEKVLVGKKGKKLRFNLLCKLLCVSIIPIIVLAVVLVRVGGTSIQDGMKSEFIDKLKVQVTNMEVLADTVDSGDFTLDEQGNLLKGSYNLTENEAIIDSMVKDSEVEVTYFYDNIRRATTVTDASTGKRAVGTEAAEEIYEAVVKNGETYEAYDADVNGEQYYAYYAPMKNSDGSIVGMYFAGAPSKGVIEYITKRLLTLASVGIGVSAFSLVLVLICVFAIRKNINKTKEVIEVLSTGDINVAIEEKFLKRGDELGDMLRAVNQLKSELLRVVGKVKESAQVLLDSGKELSTMAGQTSSTADEIGHAVEDISKGAVSQAEEIENASASVEEMGRVIEKIVHGVKVLDEASDEMKLASDESTVIIQDLSTSNDKTMNAIGRIGEQVNATNDSANKISEAVQLITSIAEETNLLSLNASIEAARAGEQGRGFAVVANQIQKLAEQSNESAGKIAEIIRALLQDSENTVAVMSEVQQIVNEQQEKLTHTKEQFANVQKGIDNSRTETGTIRTETDVCDADRKTVVDIISNLSAISEENAASTEETTASMQELNATINLLAESANNLTELSADLEREIEFFKI